MAALEIFYGIGELAKELGTTPRAIRLYEAKGLIAPRRVGSRRIYTRRERGRLILILRGKRLGFSLEDIGKWLDLYDADSDELAQSAFMMRGIEARIAKLERRRRDIDDTLSELCAIRDQVVRHGKLHETDESRSQA